MKKTWTSKLIALVLILSLLAAAPIPVCADEEPEDAFAPTWQNIIESVAPVGDPPSVKLKLTPTGYVFADCSIPRVYDVTFKDGSTTRIHISSQPDNYENGWWYGNLFDVSFGDETITLYADVCLDHWEDQRCFFLFEIGQSILIPESDWADEVGVNPGTYHAISGELFEAEVDDSASFSVRFMYFFYSIFERIQTFFYRLRYRITQIIPT